MKGWPWNHGGDHGDEVDPEAAIKVTFEEKAPIDEPADVQPEAAPIPRSMRIGKTDLAQHGYTDGCAGCEATRSGTASRAHSEACAEPD